MSTGTTPTNQGQCTDRLNADYIPEIELANENYLKIKHDGKPNRTKITADQVGNTRYYALLQTVQFDNYNGESAALLVFNFHFGFREQRLDRYYFASIRIEFEETGDADFTPPTPRNLENDPQVEMVLPVQIYGNPEPEKKTKTWNLAGSLTATTPVPGGPQAAVNPSYNRQSEYAINRRMIIQGELEGNDDHPNFQNAALWTIEENSVQETGILHNWNGAIVMKMPRDPKRSVKASMRIEASVKFSVNPARLWPKRDEPILLVPGISKGEQYAPDMDFTDPAFPWNDVLQMPREYLVRLVKSLAVILLNH